MPVGAALTDPADDALGDEKREHGAECVRSTIDDESRFHCGGYEPSARISAVVTGTYIVTGPGPLLGRHRYKQYPPGGKHPIHFGESGPLVRAVLDDVKRTDHVERAGVERQCRCRGTDSFTGVQSARIQIDRDPLVVATHPSDARSVGASDVQQPARGPQICAKRSVQQSGPGPVPPVMRAMDRG